MGTLGFLCVDLLPVIVRITVCSFEVTFILWWYIRVWLFVGGS